MPCDKKSPSLKRYYANKERYYAVHKTYRRTIAELRKTDIKYLAMALYQYMKTRVGGHGKEIFKGLEICSTEEFYNFAINNENLKRLMIQWRANGYSSRYAPTVDRIDSARGYLINNIQFLSKLDNTIKSHIQRRKNKEVKLASISQSC
jgi:hypothetical protein